MRLLKIGAVILMLVMLTSSVSVEASSLAIIRPKRVEDRHIVPVKVFQVSNASVSATSGVDLGNNFVRFGFEGSITTNGAGVVNYRWIRSDGTAAAVNTLLFDAASTKKVNIYWQYAKKTEEMHQWQAIEIILPNSLQSNQAGITVPAMTKVTSASASSTGVVDLGYDTLKYNFEGNITTNGAGVVKYRWIRNDGTGPESGVIKELRFEAAGTQKVSTYWQIDKQPQEFRISETVEIVSPNKMQSNPAIVTVPRKSKT